MSDVLQFALSGIIGFAASSVVALLAYKKHALSRSGAFAAIGMGTVIYVSGGWFFIGVLLTFFLSGSLLSRLGGSHTKKESGRDYKQVLANGIVAMALSVLYAITTDELYRLLFGISIAVSTADTWASELGKMARRHPRNILSGREVETGLSGGVTWLGMGASVLGAVLISIWFNLLPEIMLLGFLGSVVDSLLGTIQIKYVTPNGTIVEDCSPVEGCYETIGLRFLSNNLVNLCSNVILVVCGYLLLMYA